MVARGFIPPNAVMVLGPRDATDFEVVIGVVRASHGLVLGEIGDD